MASKKNQRKKSVVDARVQWLLARRVVLHFVAFVFGGAVFGLIFQILTNPMDSLSNHVAAFWQHNFPMLVALVCMMPIFIRDTLTLSNRIAGPISRLRDTVTRIVDGDDVRPLKFRANDMWEDLPELFNRMVARLQNGPEAGQPADPTVDDVLVRPSPATESVRETVEV